MDTSYLLQKSDTSTLSNRINLKANTADVTSSLNLKANTTDVNTSLATKVDKITGKDLSTNDYTTAEKTKLAAITGTNTGDQINITGNAATATKLATSRNINGVAFDGSSDITVTADAGTLTGTTLALNVVNSSLTSVGTLTSGTISLTTNIATSGTLKAGTVTYPNAHGSSGQVLSTTGSGTLSWTSFPSNYVTTNTSQTITEAKSFTKDLTINGITVGKGAGNIASNSAFGNSALSSNTGGYNNTASGYGSLISNTTGVNNTAFGFYSLRNSITGSNNTAIGTFADVGYFGVNNLTNSTAIGYNAQAKASNATAIGSGSVVVADNTIQLGNTAVTNVNTSGTISAGAVTYPNTDGIPGQVLSTSGSGSLIWTTPFTISIGAIAGTSDPNGASITSGVLNLAPADGTNGGGIVTTGTQNFAGFKTFLSDVIVNGITFGRGGGNQFGNTASGEYALYSNISGSENTASGQSVLAFNTTGSANTASGFTALSGNTLGSANTASGYTALSGNTVGNNNTAIGYGALYANTDGNNNTAIGYAANVASGSLINATAIGNGASVTTSNTIQLGNTDVTNVNTSGTITAGTVTYPNAHNSSSGQVLITDINGVATFGSIPILNQNTTGSAATLTTSRNINGVAFDGSTDITVTADAGTLTGTTLASDVVNSSLTSVGTITSGVWSGTAVAVANGGTGLTNLTKGYIPFGDESNAFATSSNFMWKNSSLGIGVTDPGQGFNTMFDVGGRASFRMNSINKALIIDGDPGNTYSRIYTDALSGTPDDLVFGTYPNGHTKQLFLKQSNGYVGINNNNPIAQLDVDGSINTSGTITAGTVTYPNAHNSTNGQVLTTDINGVATFSSIPILNQNTTGSAATLTTARNINGVAFDGSADITVTADAGTLTGTTLASDVVNSSLTSVGTITSGVWSGTTIAVANGGTGTTNGSISGTSALTFEAGGTNQNISIKPSGTGSVFVGNGTITPTSSSAILEASSTTQGFLPPRLTTTQRDAITAPVEGLTIWNKTNTQLEVYDGSYWRNMLGILVSPIRVGDTYGGGKVFYIFNTNDVGFIQGQTHGLIAATEDQTTDAGVKWFPDKYYGATGTYIGLGLPNTLSIILSAALTGTTDMTSFAAGLANSYRGGGYMDWFLPSKDELNLLYQNREAVGGFATTGYPAYWSSTQKGGLSFTKFEDFAKGVTSARLQFFYTGGSPIQQAGTITDLGINNPRRVRAIRIF